MDKAKRQLKGSPSRDAFKKWHKFLIDTFYASDIDFVLVSKNPPGIIAVLDYKKPGDDVTFAEVLAYNNLLELGLSVYIIVGNEPFDKLKIYRYLGGGWKPDPPKVSLRFVTETKSRADFATWEKRLRQEHNLKGMRNQKRSR